MPLLEGRPTSIRRALGAPEPLPPAVQAQLLRSAIGHAAVLSDTPEKWAATIALLKQHGVDPAGYDDFDEGRPLAIAASGVGARSRQSKRTIAAADSVPGSVPPF